MGAQSSNQATESTNETNKCASTITVPPMFTTKNDFIRTWPLWKLVFLTYVKNIDQDEINKQKWGVLLLNRMGPVGQEIYKTFTFHGEENAKDDIDVLIKKFNIYCIRDKKRDDNENIDKYIDDLKSIIGEHSDHMSILKEKIIQDITTHHFPEKTMLWINNIFCNKQENLTSYLQSLNVNDIIFFWKQCETLAQKDYKEIQNSTMNVEFDTLKCIRCGTQHDRNQCPARGAQCAKCKQINHFTENCKFKYIDNCFKCGTSHIVSHCPAYGEFCTKCGKGNHFSWKCQTSFINNCSRCGTDHIASACPQY